MIDPPEVLVLGPYMTNIDGNPGTVIPRCARAPPAHASASARPPEPTTSIGNMKSLVAKPVAWITQSTACSVPSAVSTPAGVMPTIRSVTSSTLGRCSAGRYEELNSTRLQPKVWSGHALRRTSGSRSCRRMNAAERA